MPYNMWHRSNITLRELPMPHYTKHITYCADTHDYMLGLGVDGGEPELVGYAHTVHAAGTTLDTLIAELTRPVALVEQSLDEQILMWSRAYLSAKAAGRMRDATLYRERGMELIVERQRQAA